MPELSTKPQNKKDKKKKEARDLADPKLRDKHAKDASYGYIKAGEDERNRAVYYGMKATDIYQGSVADCYFVAALSAAAAAQPGILEQSFKDNGDNTYSVRFFRKENYWSRSYEEDWVTVDGDLPGIVGTDRLKYAKGQKTRGGGRELWPGLFEKAFAEWKGGYNVMGEGGSSAGALEALIGAPATYKTTVSTPADRMWQKIQKATEGGEAVTAGTYGKDRDDLYKGTRLYAWHAYTVLGASTRGRGKDKKKMVKLRNPWGQVEPGNDGKDDGIFELTLEDFMKFYSSVNFTNLNK